MILFPDNQIELWEYSENTEEVDWWGETQPFYEYIGTYTCDFQNLSPKDSQQQYGEILEDTYKVYLPIDTPITHTTILRKPNELDTYTIKGTPQTYNHLIPHIKVTVQKQRKPTKLGE